MLRDYIWGILGLIIMLGITGCLIYDNIDKENHTVLEHKNITVFYKNGGNGSISGHQLVVVDTNREEYLMYDTNLFLLMNEGREYTVVIKKYTNGRKYIIDVKW